MAVAVTACAGATSGARLVWAAAPAEAVPADATAKAKALYLEAERHYMLAEFGPAIEKYKAAYRLRAEPIFLFNIGQAYRKAGDATEAIRFYRNYLLAAPDASNRAEVERFVEELEASVKAAAAAAARPPSEPLAPPETGSSAAPAAGRAATAATALPTGPPARPRRTGLWIGVGAGAVALVAGGVALAVWRATRPSEMPWVADFRP